MIEFAAILASLLLAGLATFQLSLVLGAPWGKYAWGGAYTVIPTKYRIGSVISIILYSSFASTILSKAELIQVNLGNNFLQLGMWIITAYLLIGVGMNAISKSHDERRIMTPVAIALFLLFLYVAIQST